jgi:hypothetical protein
MTICCPSILNEIGKRYGVQLEKRTIPFGEGDRKESEVYFMPITEEMRNDILSEGLPMFKQGGSVKKFAPGGKVLKGISEGVKAAKNISKKDLQTIGSELETSRGLLPDVAKKYPQIRDASVAGIESITKGDPFTAYRGISLLPGRDLESEIMPSTTLSPGVALNILRDAPVMIRNNEFISPTSVLRQYPNIKPTDVEVFVPSMIEQIRERQPGALEMKIPTRSGGKMLINDIFDEVLREKEVLTDVTGKTPTDIKFDRHGGGFMDQLLMGVARDVFSGNWKGGENYLKEIGGYYTNPDEMIQEFDAFATSIAPTRKAKGGSVNGFAPGGKVLKEIAKGASDAAKAAQKARRTPQLEQFLDKSKVKEQMYRGQRRAPQATGFALTQGRGTPSFTTDPEVANVYSRQLGWGSPEYGPGSTVMPAYLQMENPLDLRSYGEHITLSDFIENLPNVDLSKARVNNGFGYEDVAEMVRGIGSVAGKTGAQYEIEAASPGTPFRMKEFGELADAIEEMGAAGKPETIDMMLFDTSIDAFLIGDSKNVRNALKDAGYDGVIHKDAFDVGGEYYQGDKKNLEGGNYAEYIHDSYRPFFQEKIKSSIGNVGEYDITNPDITKAKGGALRSVTSGAQRAAKEGQKMLQGVYRGYTGERLEEPVLSTTPQRKVAEYYATRRAATRGEDPHIEMLMVDPFVGKEYGLALPIDEFNRELLTTRARAIAPSDVVERTQLKKKGGLACLSK